ncbi:MAG TPA: hypothetical protein VK169_14690 [Saprospiraceae bacterium]|nr:hypothetical protein [Saprospiraceae bacterium]
MENVYIISDFSVKMKRLASELNIPQVHIISNQVHENEKDYHNWLNTEFGTKNIEKIIIPISISDDGNINTNGLLLGLHIRLNYELPLSKRLLPIIFLTNFTVENLIKKNHFDRDNNPQNLIFTQGVYFSSFFADDILNTIGKAEACPESEYRQNCLDKINVHRKDTIGGHDIANAWGCFKLAQVVGIKDKIFELDIISKHLKQLYAKFLICKNESFSPKTCIDLLPLKCVGKKILFIDDKSDEGWGLLMKQIFKGAGTHFVSIDSSKYKANDYHSSFKDFDGFYDECLSHVGQDWDLIIIDLRLNPDKEDIDNELITPTEFSGYKLIHEFLKANEGYQIIVSTASNKIWNVNAALERGASAYYIKESPEFNYTIKETQRQYENFKKDVINCFQKDYLRDIYNLCDAAKQANSNSDTIFKQESNSMLDIAWNLIVNEQLDFGYLTLFQIIEVYANQKYDYRDNSIELDGVKNYMIEADDDNEIWKLTFNRDNRNGDYFSCGDEQKSLGGVRANTLYKASCILKYKYERNDSFLKEFGNLNDLRHKIAHEGVKGQARIENIKKILEIIQRIRQ